MNIATVTLCDSSSVAAFRPGDRVAIGPRPRWYVRAWRWLTKNNLRVASVDVASHVITLERCR
jgi:hypothetical protein